ncbi:MAG TPA: hypothetical protein VGF94_04570 [Kofleriaceae bacterium]|jgi:hypothetical protein
MRLVLVCALVACGGTHSGGGGGGGDAGEPAGDGPAVGACPVFPANFIFNTRIDSLPMDNGTSGYISTIGGSVKVHLDLGTETDQQQDDYYGIPSNVVTGNSFAWPQVSYSSTDPGLDWDPLDESDCGTSQKGVVSPCPGTPAPLPMPAMPLVESGVQTDQSNYGDHHVLLVDSDNCRLWELYHVYSDGSGGWDIFGSASWDLRSTALRPMTWTSSDAAGFPIYPLLLRADEASSGHIDHALRFTIPSASIRTSYVWPARHQTDNGTASASLPPMGQLFRLKAGYQIPSGFHTQSVAILTAMQQYGLYIADGGSAMFVQGEPSAAWADETFSEVQSVTADNFEAVDITAIMSRSGFDVNTGAVPP